MKRLLSLSIFLMTAMLSFAHDFESGLIYYNITSSIAPLTVEVTYKGTSYSQYDNEYRGFITIPETVTFDSKTYSVTAIGDNAFTWCSSLSYVTIPNSISRIGDYAFSECYGLTSITIPNSVTTIGDYAFRGLDRLRYVDIPNSVMSIGKGAFTYCSGLTSVTIPNSVMSIGKGAFNYCSGLIGVFVPDIAAWCNISFGDESANPLYYAEHIYDYDGNEITDLAIPNSVTSIGDYAFYRCSGLTSVSIPNSVKKIGDFAFSRCDNLTSIELGDHVSFGGNSFSTYNSETRLYVNKCSITFLWLSFSRGGLNGSGQNPYHDCLYDKANRNKRVSFITTTASSIRLTDLEPENYKITSQSYKLDNVDVALGYIKHGMKPETKTNFDSKIEYLTDDGVFGRIDNTKTITTKAIPFKSLQPKTVSVGNVVVSAESYVDDEEKNVGFEWRRTDWTDDFKSNTGAAYLFEGTMEGYIRNLYTGALWKVRPYYMADDGTYYYGEWVGVDPVNTSYFEPTIHTYANIEVNGNTAQVKGYAQNGTDNFTSQGFKYWKTDNLARSENFAAEARSAAANIPANAQTVEAEGRVMEATLSGLDYESTYSYVAFAKTVEGMFYGEIKTFTTGPDVTGIEVIRNSSSEKKAVDDKVKGIYTLTGVKVSDDVATLKTLKRGVYIVNGRKVAVK